MNRISFLNRGYAFKGLLAVIKGVYFSWTCFPDDTHFYLTLLLGCHSTAVKFSIVTPFPRAKIINLDRVVGA